MDLKTSIEQDLWEIIAKNYENESYSSAILDAMHLLTENIRNKTGLEGDGSSLVGQAFGGENPKIQLNKLQTESEKNIQKGIQEILKGLYTAIRNPRSHDKLTDTKEEADSIIYFINYLLKIIDKSKLCFEESTFLKRVFDKLFVNSTEYAELLVNEIPKRQRLNIAISVILQRKKGNIFSLGYFMASLFKKLEDSDLTHLYKLISEELKLTSSDEDIRTILHICPAKDWKRMDKAVRIRIENIIIEDVKLGTYSSENEEWGTNGALGTWVEEDHLSNFENCDNWTRLIVNKLESGGTEEIEYINMWYWDKICAINREKIHYSLKKYICEGLKNKNEEIANALESKIEFDEEHPWWKIFEEELKEYPDIKYFDVPW